MLIPIVVGTWFAFKYTLRKRAIRMERANLNYGALARMTRDGGFWVSELTITINGSHITNLRSQVILIIRLSAVPSHFSTAVFSTCDVNFWYFVIATFLSLPKQIFLVYLGVLVLQKDKNNTVQTVVFVSLFIVTMIMAGWIWYKMRGIKKVLLREQDERRVANAKTHEGIDGEWSHAIVGPEGGL